MEERWSSAEEHGSLLRVMRWLRWTGLALIGVVGISGVARGQTPEATPSVIPDLHIAGAQVVVDEKLEQLIFQQTVAGEAGGTVPEATGEMEAATVIGYVFPTTMSPADVGFRGAEGIVGRRLRFRLVRRGSVTAGRIRKRICRLAKRISRRRCIRRRLGGSRQRLLLYLLRLLGLGSRSGVHQGILLVKLSETLHEPRVAHEEESIGLVVKHIHFPEVCGKRGDAPARCTVENHQTPRWIQAVQTRCTCRNNFAQSLGRPNGASARSACLGRKAEHGVIGRDDIHVVIDRHRRMIDWVTGRKPPHQGASKLIHHVNVAVTRHSHNLVGRQPCRTGGNLVQSFKTKSHTRGVAISYVQKPSICRPN